MLLLFVVDIDALLLLVIGLDDSQRYSSLSKILFSISSSFTLLLKFLYIFSQTYLITSSFDVTHSRYISLGFPLTPCTFLAN